ncbi:MAG: branched-chain amino acid ABC transporter substrate-binding protein [Alphaproteobacteria bacterium]|nr:branched-chain amino acid ABC transporter substrate-binding protein [Alphaproteobacteria bacterium]
MKKIIFGFAALMLATAPARADITIVAQGSITGQDATSGEQLKNGAEAAVDAINAHGGVLGQKLHLIIRDDACDPKQGVAIANELGDGSVFAVIGPTCSGTAIPAARIYNEEGVIMISPSATNPELTEQGYADIFRTCGRDDQQGKAVADYMLRHDKTANIAVIDDKTAYGHGIAAEVERDLAAGGKNIALEWSITRGERDYASLIAKMKENNIGAVFFGGYHTEAGLIVRQMRDAGVKAAFISDDDLTTREFWSITGAAGTGAMMSFNPDPRGKPEAADAVRRIRARGFEPEGLTLYTYAAVQALADAITRAGAVDDAKVAAQLHQGTYDTVIGPISFDAKGDVDNPDYIIYRWADGDYAPVKE